jgi:hypothetical protein
VCPALLEQDPSREDCHSPGQDRSCLLRKVKTHDRVHKSSAVHSYILHIYSAITSAAACVKVDLANPNLWLNRR